MEDLGNDNSEQVDGKQHVSGEWTLLCNEWCFFLFQYVPCCIVMRLMKRGSGRGVSNNNKVRVWCGCAKVCASL